MTNEQFERWKDFAFRMARTLYADSVRPPVSWIIGEIAGFFGCIHELEIVTLESWNHSARYPEGHEFYRVEFQRPCWCRDKSPGAVADEDCLLCGGSGTYKRVPHGPLICDRMSDWEWDELRPQLRSLISESDLHWLEINEDVFDDDSPPFEQELIDEIGGPVVCCIRAGMDFAAAPSAGVIGFTAGDLRAMFPEGVPDWVKTDEKWCPAFVVEHDESDCSYFDELPDDQCIVM